jgi:hypothetical protein
LINGGNGRVFCTVKRKLPENESCENFTEYADLSKEVRSQYAFEIRDVKMFMVKWAGQ